MGPEKQSLKGAAREKRKSRGQRTQEAGSEGQQVGTST